MLDNPHDLCYNYTKSILSRCDTLANVIRDTSETSFFGCDFVLQLPQERNGDSVRLLQLTDMQVIDSLQRAYPERLGANEIEAWLPENFDIQCGNHIRSLIAQTRPDLIFITGDIVYGSFDSSGKVMEWFCELMDSFEIPWAPVFGNHDNETEKGVSWQCEQFYKSKFCLFRRGEVSGNGNYTVGIAIGDKLIRVLHMLDSNGCKNGNDESIIKEKGIYPDQLELVSKNTELITASQGRSVPAFVAFHIPVDSFKAIEQKKGYAVPGEKPAYFIGVNVAAKDDDFGFNLEDYKPIETDGHFIEFLKKNNIEAAFAGHQHKNCTCISYDGIKWVFGLKTGQYDYHLLGQVGGTLVTLRGDEFTVNHVPALVRLAPTPSTLDLYKKLQAEGKNI